MSIAILQTVKNSQFRTIPWELRFMTCKIIYILESALEKIVMVFIMAVDEKVCITAQALLSWKLKTLTRFEVLHHKDKACVSDIKWSAESTRQKALHWKHLFCKWPLKYINVTSMVLKNNKSNLTKYTVAVFLPLVLVASRERTMKQKAQIETRNSILKVFCDWTLEEVAQWGCGISSLGDAQNLSGHGSEQPAAAYPALSRVDWTKTVSLSLFKCQLCCNPVIHQVGQLKLWQKTHQIYFGLYCTDQVLWNVHCPGKPRMTGIPPTATAPVDCLIVWASERSDKAWQKAEGLYVFDSKKIQHFL